MKRTYNILAFFLGFSCFIVQLVLIREFMSLFAGNELIIGIVLALWMLLTAAGALAGRYFSKSGGKGRSIFFLLILNAISPIAGALLSVYLRTVLYAPGVMIGLDGTLIIGIAGMAAFCLASGMLFTMLASSLSALNKENSISRIYSIEALGSLAGGLIFNFVLIYTMNSMRILVFLMMLNILIAFGFAFINKMKILALVSLILGICLSICLFRNDPDILISELKYPGINLLLNEDTPFGKLVVAEDDGQINFFSNGKPLAFSDDIVEREEKVHYAMTLHPAPKEVLLLSGGLYGAIDEVLKYPEVNVTYVEPDPWLLEAARKYEVLKIPKGITIIEEDPISFLWNRHAKYDVILMNMSPPETIGSNRYFTCNFMHRLQKQLNDLGIVCFALEGSGNYLSEENRLIFASIYNSIKLDYTYSRIIPGNKTYFLFSDSPLEGNITELIKEKSIQSSWVNADYLDDQQMDERAAIIIESLDIDFSRNTDFRPLPAYLSMKRWLSIFHIPLWLVFLIPALLMLMILLRLSTINLGLFSTGFSSSASELLLLIAFQLAYGFVYQMVGLIIMVFMAGLALGSGYTYRYFPETKKMFFSFQLAMALLMLMLPVVMIIVSIPSFPLPHWLVISGNTFVIAILTGMQYRLGTKLREGSANSVAASTYGADLAGSAFGLFFIAIFIFPLWGIIYTGLILAGLNFIVLAIMVLRGRSRNSVF